ncbi:MAG: flagellar protein FlgN [bacterium]
MQQYLPELLELLKEEILHHAALEHELEQEADLDGSLNGSELLQIQMRKTKCVRDIRDLEERRIELVSRIAQDWGESTEAITLSRIIGRAPIREGQALQQCYSELQDLVHRIRNLAQVTSANAQARLKAIDATLAAIKEALKIHSTYSEAGHLQKATPTLKSTSA